MDKTTQIKEDLTKLFGHLLDDNLMKECIDLCRHFNVTAEDLFYKWESLRLGLGARGSEIRVFTDSTIASLQDQLQREAPKAQAGVKTQQPASKARLDGLLSGNLGGLGRSFVKTEPKKEQRSGVDALAGPSKVKVTCADLGDSSTSSERRYRYMYEKMSERSEALDDRIDEFAELVQSHYKFDDLADPAASTEEETTIVGRITFDADSSSATPIKLNEESLTLESSRSMGAGARVHLKFDPNVRLRGAKQGIGGAGLFPGAIVALRGKNGGGGWFTVTEVLPLPPLPVPSTNVAEASSFSVSIACGPFTADADLKYEPWKALVTKLKHEKPEIIILVGPFIDCTHVSIKNGEVDMSPADMFRSLIMEPLQQLLDAAPGTTVIIIPSVRDMVSDHAVFPQAELRANVIDDPRICSFPNPCRFSLNGIFFAVSSVDVLFHLRKEEFLKPMSEVDPTPVAPNETPPSDAMAKICRHILQQRSFYPIFPPPSDVAHEVNLDVSHWDRLRLTTTNDAAAGSAAPSVLVLPSKLKQFHKIIDETTVVNPSFTNKGTYTKMRIENDMAVQVEISKISE